MDIVIPLWPRSTLVAEMVMMVVVVVVAFNTLYSRVSSVLQNIFWNEETH